MYKIAVYHPFYGNGGAESVCMHVLEALQDDYDLEFISMEPVDIETENDYIGTNVNPNIETSQLGVVGQSLDRSMNLIDRAVGRNFGRLHAAMFSRFGGRQSEFDLIFSTHGELVTKIPSIQYIHFPWYSRALLPEELKPSSPIANTYNRVCDLLAGHDPAAVRRQRLLTNSNWTADLLEKLYGMRPETVYPPVRTEEFNPRPWGHRENGFVCVGRLAPSKNIHRNVKIVDQLRDRGHDVHLHVVGPTSEGSYGERIADLAANRSHIHLEGRIPRERLVDLLCTHRYGIHGMEREHFGIAVAELVAGGAIPFIPSDGGQVEIVDSLESITYDSETEAVKKADQVLRDPDRQQEIREALPDVQMNFGPERFKQRIRGIVAETIEHRVNY